MHSSKVRVPYRTQHALLVVIQRLQGTDIDYVVRRIDPLADPARIRICEVQVSSRSLWKAIPSI